MSSAGASLAGSSLRAISVFSGLTTKKNTTAAMVRKVIAASMKRPYGTPSR
jgi:hypothetical protein